MTPHDEQPVRLGRVLWFILGISLVVHAVSLILGQTAMREWRWPHHPVHASIESAGAIIALTVAWMLISLEKRAEGTSYNIWIAAALCGMGILDGLHALVHAGKTFVWLHSTATFVGGLLFACVWLSKSWISNRKYRWPAGVSTVAVFFGVVSLAAPAMIPNMVSDGRFTVWAKSLNVGGGILLFAAAVRLVLTWRQTRNVDDLLFSLHCILFGAAAIMFEQSALWDAPWWGWHFLRLMAYGVALWFVILTAHRTDHKFQETTEQLRVLSSSLEERVAERTQELERSQKELTQANSQLTDANAELERFNRIAVGREQRMIELKRQVNEFAQLAGSQPQYDLSFADDRKRDQPAD